MLPLLKNEIPPRPTFAQVFAQTVYADVLLWISHQEKRLGKKEYAEFVLGLPKDEDDLNMMKLLEAVAAHSEPDSFMYCASLRDTLDWPVNGALAEVFAEGIRLTETKYLRQRTIEWVMKTGTRLHAKPGDGVTFLDKDRTRRAAVVKEVDRPTASAIIETADTARHNIIAEQLVA